MDESNDNIRLIELLTQFTDDKLDDKGLNELDELLNDDTIEEASQYNYLLQCSEFLKRHPQDSDLALKKVHKRIFKHRFEIFAVNFQKVAAVLLIPLLMLGGYLSFKLFKTNDVTPESITDIVVKTNSGMISSAVLPDSTVVWLNSNSKLTYPSKFSDDARRVRLEGEAFFDVRKSASQKFIVSTDAGMQIVVHGTKFNVESYNHNHDIRTTLVKGKIDVNYKDLYGKSHIMQMHPNQQFVLNKETKRGTCDYYNTKLASSWIDGKIFLENTSLQDAFRMIENMYNVRFVIKNKSILNNSFTGEFVGQRLDTVLEHFRLTANLRFVREDSRKSTIGEDSPYEIITVY